MNDVLQWIAQYWVSWVCALIAGGVIFFAKRYISMEKKSIEEKWKDKESSIYSKVNNNFNEKFSGIEEEIDQKNTAIYKEIETLRRDMSNKDDNIFVDLNNIHNEINAIQSGILSIQGKQFREMCVELLKKDFITVEEYEEFESEYAVYKNLGGKGDALHARVVAKCDKQDSKE